MKKIEINTEVMEIEIEMIGIEVIEIEMIEVIDIEMIEEIRTEMIGAIEIDTIKEIEKKEGMNGNVSILIIKLIFKI